MVRLSAESENYCCYCCCCCHFWFCFVVYSPSHFICPTSILLWILIHVDGKFINTINFMGKVRWSNPCSIPWWFHSARRICNKQAHTCSHTRSHIQNHRLIDHLENIPLRWAKVCGIFPLNFGQRPTRPIYGYIMHGHVVCGTFFSSHHRRLLYLIKLQTVYIEIGNSDKWILLNFVNSFYVIRVHGRNTSLRLNNHGRK